MTKYIEQAPNGELTSPTGDEHLPVTDGTNDWWIRVKNLIARKLRETSGPTTLDMGAITDGQYLRRSGSSIIGDDPSGGAGGWMSDANTWSYVSADSPSFVAEVNSDLTSLLSKGMRVSLQQEQALSGYWSFDVDSTPDVGGFTMADIGTPTYTAGKFSNAFTGDGSTDALSITDTETLKPTGAFTIGAWIKCTVGGSIFSSYSANPNNAGIYFRVSGGGKLALLVGNNTGTTVNLNYSDHFGNTTITDGNWHYVVATVKDRWVQMYVDGVLDYSGYGYVNPAYAGTNYIRIGCTNMTGVNTYHFNGQIDDLFIINGYALDERTILEQYRADEAQGSGEITITKYFIVTNVGEYSGSATQITMYGGTDFSLANSTITNPRFSAAKVPFGFNANPDKWSVTAMSAVDYSQASPVSGNWYNLGWVNIAAPIGLWVCSYQVNANATAGSATSVQVRTTLSTGTTTESHPATTRMGSVSSVTSLSVVLLLYGFTLELTAKTTFYLNTRTFGTMSSINNYNVSLPLVIRLVSAYL